MTDIDRYTLHACCQALLDTASLMEREPAVDWHPWLLELLFDPEQPERTPPVERRILRAIRALTSESRNRDPDSPIPPNALLPAPAWTDGPPRQVGRWLVIYGLDGWAMPVRIGWLADSEYLIVEQTPGLWRRLDAWWAEVGGRRCVPLPDEP